jgi:glycolate oxidase
MTATDASIVAALTAALTAGRVLTDPATTESLAHDEAEWAPYGRPAAVVRPLTTAEVAGTVRACRAGALTPARAVKAAWDPHDILNPGEVLG